jgi:hypothetical protein
MIGFALPAALKLLSPAVIKKIMSYVFEENDLDKKMNEVVNDVKQLKEQSHPPIFTLKERDRILDKIDALEKKINK